MDNSTRKRIRQRILAMLDEKSVLVKSEAIKNICREFDLDESKQAYQILEIYRSTIGNEAEWTHNQFQDAIRKSPAFIREQHKTKSERAKEFILSAKGISLVASVLLIASLILDFIFHGYDSSYFKENIITIITLVFTIFGFVIAK